MLHSSLATGNYPDTADFISTIKDTNFTVNKPISPLLDTVLIHDVLILQHNKIHSSGSDEKYFEWRSLLRQRPRMHPASDDMSSFWGKQHKKNAKIKK